MYDKLFVAACFFCEVDTFFDLTVGLQNLEDCVSIEICLILLNELSEVHLENLKFFLLVLKFSLDLLWSLFLTSLAFLLIQILDN